MNNAQVALEAASRVHQKAGAGNSYSTDLSRNRDVLETADEFLAWLNNNTPKDEFV